MPALTYSQINEALSSYKDPAANMKAVLNQVISRLYATGIYRDLTIQYQLPIVDGCITLPKNAESILLAQINKEAAIVRSLWHDFKAAGMSNTIEPTIWGLVDAGYHATQKFLDEPITELIPVASVYDTNKASLNFSHFSLDIVGTDGDNMYKATYVNNHSEHTHAYVFSQPVDQITSIIYTKSSGVRIVDLRTDPDDAETTLATLGPENMVTRYRRFRVPTASADTTVHVLVKRAFEPIVNDNDIVFISNLAAIKHGLLAVVAEDNADLERATYHWTEAQKNMEREMESARGSAIPNIQFDILGIGGRSEIRSMM
jgi:hypothetical protein